MTSSRLNNTLSGVLIVNKPAGLTSFEVVRKVKKALGVKKIGHTGTLDPMATGLLVLCLNQATKVVPFLQEGEKVYTGSIILGLSTDTDDITGRVTLKKALYRLNEEDIISAADEFIGRIEQVPPDYSAVKYQGRPGYELARRGEKIPARSREVVIHNLTITGISLPRISFLARVSKGVYIRSLAADIGRRLRTGACLESLTRLANASFRLEQAVSLEEVEALSRGDLLQRVVPLDKALSFLPAVCVSDEQMRLVADGRQLPWPYDQTGRLGRGPVRVLSPDRSLLAVYEYNPLPGSHNRDYLKPIRVMKPAG